MKAKRGFGVYTVFDDCGEHLIDVNAKSMEDAVEIVREYSVGFKTPHWNVYKTDPATGWIV